MIDAYIYTSCTSCRKTVEQLKTSGVDYTTRDFFRDRFTREELQAVLDQIGLGVRDVLSVRSKVYLERSAEIEALDDDALLDMMLVEPTLLRRPLVVKGSDALIGHNTVKLAELIAS